MNTLNLRDDPTARRRAVAFWVRLTRVYHKMERLLVAQLRTEGLSMAQFDVLAQVGGSEGLTQQELADRLLVTKGNVTQLLDRMTEAGLIERRSEGRCNRLYLTEAGRRLFAQAVPDHEVEMAHLVSGLSPEEQRVLAGLLRKLDYTLE